MSDDPARLVVCEIVILTRTETHFDCVALVYLIAELRERAINEYLARGDELVGFATCAVLLMGEILVYPHGVGGGVHVVIMSRKALCGKWRTQCSEAGAIIRGMKISVTELRSLVDAALTKQGYSPEETVIIAEVLLYAQLRGNNQGVVKLIGAGIPKSADAQVPSIEKETAVSAFVDAHQTHAMLAVHQATDMAIYKAQEHGVGLVGVHGINTSSGALGFYAKKIADAGLVGIICSGSMETVAVYGSSEAILGTNPIAIAVPAQGSESLVFDTTTAAMAYFGVVEAATAGRALPPGIAYDKNGTVTTNPADVLEGGAIRSFDGSQRGSGLSVMIQALTGPLMGAYFTGIGDVDKNWGGHFIMAFRPDLFQGIEATRTGVTQMIEKVKATRKLPETQEIFVPGERGNRRAGEALASDSIELEDKLYAELQKAAA